MGAKAVLVKGGHRIADATDVLFDGKDFHYYKGKRIESTSTHGTGCSLSSAIASNLANGMNLSDAVQAAKTYVFEGIAHAEPIGKGHGPIHHSMNYTRKQGCSNMKLTYSLKKTCCLVMAAASIGGAAWQPHRRIRMKKRPATWQLIPGCLYADSGYQYASFVTVPSSIRSISRKSLLSSNLK